MSDTKEYDGKKVFKGAIQFSETAERLFLAKNEKEARMQLIEWIEEIKQNLHAESVLSEVEVSSLSDYEKEWLSEVNEYENRL